MLIAGALMVLAFAPFEIWVLAIISLAALFFMWSRRDGAQAALLGYCFGLGLFGVGVSWLHISINLFGGVSLLGSYLITFTLVAFLALYPALVGYLSGRYFSRSIFPGLLVAIPTTWVVVEWCRSWIFTGFPWLNLGYSMIDTWFVGLAPITGVYGIGWITAICAAICAALISVSGRCRVILALSLCALTTLGFFSHRIHWTTADPDTRSVALVQAAIPQQLKWDPKIQRHTLDLYLDLTRPWWGKDLIIWPETAIPMFYQDATPLLNALQKKATTTNTGMIIGVPYRDSDQHKYFNSIITLGKQREIYHKRHLVPFGEYLPFDQLIRPILDTMGIPMSNFSSGDARPLLLADGIPVGVSICYEDVFGEEVIDALPEAKVLVNVSNDAWFGDSLAPHQHLEMARMRAAETGRYLLRATNTGISAIIDETGKIKSESPQFKPDALIGTVTLFSGSTPYSVYGNYLVVLLAILVLLACYYLERKPEKSD